jgi:hypothetical protein
MEVNVSYVSLRVSSPMFKALRSYNGFTMKLFLIGCGGLSRKVCRPLDAYCSGVLKRVRAPGVTYF